MSRATLTTLRRLVAPHTVTLEVRPGDDGPHLAGIGRDGAWHEWLSLAAAREWVNEQILTLRRQ